MATLEGCNPELVQRIEAVLTDGAGHLVLDSGFRTRAEQTALYNLWLAGKGSPANLPGTSQHEKGLAADIGADPAHAQLRADLAKKWGLCLPHPAEPWHLELDPNRKPLSPQKPVTPEQAMTLVIDPVGAVDRPQHDEGGWAFGARGHVYAYGNAQHFGGWDDATRGDPTRSCVALVSTESGQGYWLVSNKGEVWAYGDAVYPGGYQAQWGQGVIIGAYFNGKPGVTLVRDDGQNLNVYALPA